MKLLTIAFMLLALAITGCVSRTESAAAKLHDDIAASKPAAVVKADRQLVVVNERITERHNLLNIAVSACLVVAVCLVLAARFMVISSELHAVAGIAGVFAALVLALRALVSVPDWAVYLVLGVLGVYAIVRSLWHSFALAHAVHELSAIGKADLTEVSGKTMAVVQKIRAYTAHNTAPKG